jgi:hypothetical protein
MFITTCSALKISLLDDDFDNETTHIVDGDAFEAIYGLYPLDTML